MFTFIVKTDRNIKKINTNGSREQLNRVSRNVIRSCEVLLISCRLTIRKSCMKKANWNFKKNVDFEFPEDAFFVDGRAVTTVTMLWASKKYTLCISNFASFNVTLKRHKNSNFTTPPATNLIKESLWKMSVGPIHSSIICTFGFTQHEMLRDYIWETKYCELNVRG